MSQSSVVLLPAEVSASSSSEQDGDRNAEARRSSYPPSPSSDDEAYDFPDGHKRRSSREQLRSPSPESSEASRSASPAPLRHTRSGSGAASASKPVVVSLLQVPEFPHDPIAPVRRAIYRSAHAMVGDTANTPLDAWFSRVMDAPVSALRANVSSSDDALLYRSGSSSAQHSDDAAVSDRFDRLASRWRNGVRRDTHACLAGLTNLRTDLDAVFMNAQQILSQLDGAYVSYDAMLLTNIVDADLRAQSRDALRRRVSSLMDDLRCDSLRAVRSAVEANMPRETADAEGDAAAGIQADMLALKEAIESSSSTLEDAKETLRHLNAQQHKVVIDTYNSTLRAFEDAATDNYGLP